MHTKHNFFDIVSLHKPKQDKNLSGDFTLFEIIEEESLVVCALADGVSTRKDDWLASKTACNSAIDFIKNHNESIEIIIKNAVKYAHDQVRDSNNPNTGMACSMSILIWNYKSNMFYYVNVGDTRVYHIKAKDIIQLTEDDTIPIRIKIAGEPLIINGSPVYFDGMQKIIGQAADFDIEVFSCAFYAGDSIVLTSDGIHKKGGLSSSILDVISSEDIGKSLNVFIDECIDYIEDDASVIIVRRNDVKQFDKDLFDRIIKDEIKFENSNLSAHIFLILVLEKCNISISEKDINNLEKYLEMISQYSLDVDRDRMISLFDKYCDLKINNSNVYSLFSEIIKKSLL